MELGLNLCFAIKRWQEPEILADLLKKTLGVSHVQFTWDLVDPWWPEDKRNPILADFRRAFAAAGVVVDAGFGGLAGYTFPQLLAADKRQRDISLEFFKRAADVSVELGAPVLGTPVGGMSNRESADEQLRAARYNDCIKSLHDLADYGRKIGLQEIHIEATPLVTEFPSSPEQSLQMMRDLSSSAIPFKLLIDWGHALYKPLAGENPDISDWFDTCREHIGSIHLQQTDGLYDRHWDFTVDGIVTPELIVQKTQTAELDHLVQYLEIVPAFEEADDVVLTKLVQSMDILRKAFERADG